MLIFLINEYFEKFLYLLVFINVEYLIIVVDLVGVNNLVLILNIEDV